MKVRACLLVLALVASAGAAFAAGPAPEATQPVPETAALQVPEAEESCVPQEASLAVELPATNEAVTAAAAGGPVGVCLNTWCQDVGIRCSNPVWQNRGKCCDYTCVADASCTARQKPPATACDFD